MRLPKYMTRVTTFSKTLAVCMFIVFPIVGYILGLWIGTNNSPTVVIDNAKVDNSVDDRCGRIPDRAFPEKYKLDVINGPFWSPDCRFIVWSIWKSGVGYFGENGVDKNMGTKTYDREGIYLYNDKSEKIEKIYSPKGNNESPSVVGWNGSNRFEFEVKGIKYLYSLNEKAYRPK